MKLGRLLLPIIAVFIFIFAFDFLVHGYLLKGLYKETASLWRPEGDHKMAFIFASELLFAIMASYIFTLNFEGKGIGEGVRYGLLIGLLVGAIQIGTYCYMPIPLALTVAWFAGEVLRGLGAGVVLSLTYKKS